MSTKVWLSVHSGPLSVLYSVDVALNQVPLANSILCNNESGKVQFYYLLSYYVLYVMQ